MDRRRVIQSLGVGLATGLAGCSSIQSGKTADGATDTGPRTIVVDSVNGSQYGTGTAESPYKSLKRGVKEAEPGDTVRAEPGVYTGPIPIRSGGEPGKPLTITGPSDAILKGHPEHRAQPLLIRASHVHVRGMSVDGLLYPDHPDDPSSYAYSPLIDVKPPKDSNEYLEDIVVAPHGVGNAYAHMVVAQRSKDVEIGPFRVTGLAGANYVLDEEATEKHVGEIVYLGTPPDTYSLEAYPWEEIDQTRNVHVHHIDNSAGHPHAELVNTKLGTRNVLVEYCTDGGGSQNTEPYPEGAVRFQGQDATLRWCDLRDGLGNGVIISGGGRGWLEERYEERLGNETERPVDPAQIGTGYQVHGNRISAFDDAAMKIQYTSPDEQLICGNEINGDILNHHDEVYSQDDSCPDDLPSGDGIGHTGGDSPWS